MYVSIRLILTLFRHLYDVGISLLSLSFFLSLQSTFSINYKVHIGYMLGFFDWERAVNGSGLVAAANSLS